MFNLIYSYWHKPKKPNLKQVFETKFQGYIKENHNPEEALFQEMREHRAFRFFIGGNISAYEHEKARKKDITRYLINKFLDQPALNDDTRNALELNINEKPIVNNIWTEFSNKYNQPYGQKIRNKKKIIQDIKGIMLGLAVAGVILGLAHISMTTVMILAAIGVAGTILMYSDDIKTVINTNNRNAKISEKEQVFSGEEINNFDPSLAHNKYREHTGKAPRVLVNLWQRLISASSSSWNFFKNVLENATDSNSKETQDKAYDYVLSYEAHKRKKMPTCIAQALESKPTATLLVAPSPKPATHVATKTSIPFFLRCCIRSNKVQENDLYQLQYIKQCLERSVWCE